jgi:leader peptidase (prepilin peptidase)/N-methyltransferase
MQWLTAIWLFAVGSCVGSFINVVGYRMPRGESIVFRPSHCPRCQANIRFRDNIPVWGWLLLGGRCRECRQSISVRYLLVESLFGVMFTSLAYAELLSGGANLPQVQPPSSAGLTWTIVDIRPDALWIFGYHVTLLGVLLSSALIKLDGHTIPLRLLAFGAVAAVLVPVLHHGLHPVSWVSLYPAASLALPIGRPWDDLLVGLGLGGALGLILTAAIPARAIAWRALQPRPELAPLTALVGMYLGWQAAFACTLLAVTAKLAESAVASCSRDLLRMPLIAYLGLATYITICLWRPLTQWSWWPGPDSTLLTAGAVLAACVAGIVLTGLIPPRDFRSAAGARQSAD